MAVLKHDSKSIKTDLDWDFTGTVTGISTGSLVLIKTLTASYSNSLSFVNGSSGVVLDSTYKAYKFVFKNIHASIDDTDLTFQGSSDGGSNYNTTITSTFFQAYHDEADTFTSLSYNASFDQAQGSGYQLFSHSLGIDNDQSSSGELWLYNPSSTIYVKHFMSGMNVYHASDTSNDLYTAGYFNTTSAINGISFKMSSGNIDAGTISLYGLTT
tara:strand:- start:795 stop:1433 length:639 start_codon:yes stop_codon:yes gene_type:complete